MKAYQIKQLAHPSKVEASDGVPPPKPKEGEVLVDVYAAGLNFFDSGQISKHVLQHDGSAPKGADTPVKPPLPFVLGAEFAGRISASSPIPKKCRFKHGDRVYGWGAGAYGEQVAINPVFLCAMPDHLSFEQASVIGIYAGIVDRGQAKEGGWVLIHAAAGGVGLAACQIAKALGCKVIAAAGNDEKRAICKRHGGADEVVDYTKDGWQKEVMRVTGGEGVDVVFDPVGMIIPSLKCVKWNARLVVVGFAGGTIEKIPANLALLKQVSITGLAFGQTYLKDPRRAFAVQNEVHRLISDRKLTPVTFEPIYEGLSKVSQGLQDLEGRKTWGKAVVRVRNPDGSVSGSSGGSGSSTVKAKL